MKTLLLFAIAVSLFTFTSNAVGQPNDFKYQGSLSTSGQPANGNFDFEFALFDTISAGNQLGTTQAVNGLSVVNGLFTVNLNFGNQFPGANRFLEIRVRQTGQPGFTTLGPRQPIGSAPYSVKSVSADTAGSATNATTANNALNLGGVAANQYVLTSDARMSDARSPLPGSSNYIQNQNIIVQPNADLRISGEGRFGGTVVADQVITTNGYSIGANRVLAAPTGGNLFVGRAAGANNLGSNNTFVGYIAGVGHFAGSGNSYFGSEAGSSTTTTTVDNNSFFGNGSGKLTTSGFANSFFGSLSGEANVNGNGNAFFGMLAGNINVSGQSNTMIGSVANPTSGALINATAIGANAAVSQSNSLVLGSILGINNSASNTSVGIGTTAPAARFHVKVNNGNILIGDSGCGSSFGGLGFAASLTCTNYSLLGNGNDTYLNRPTGGWLYFREGNGDQMIIKAGGAVVINTLGSGGATAVCRNASNEISTCSSSSRYKENIIGFSTGLDLIRRLRPVSFNWLEGGMADLGLVAEDVAAIEPLLTTTNAKGEIEGVKYDRIGVVLINAVKEQQAEIERLRSKVAELEVIKTALCARDPKLAFCTAGK